MTKEHIRQQAQAAFDLLDPVVQYLRDNDPPLGVGYNTMRAFDDAAHHARVAAVWREE